MLSFLIGRTRKQRRRRHHVLIALGVGIACTLIFVLLQPFASTAWRLNDQLFLSTAPSPNIVIVAIDDESLATYGRWADWPRSLHAQAVENLNQARAMVIGFDVLFADESADDPILAQAMAEGCNIVLPVVGVQPVSPLDSEITYQEFLFPTETIYAASSAIGHANVVPDGDGVLRKIPLVVSDSAGERQPAFALAVLSAFFGKPIPDDYGASDGKLHLFGRNIPVDGETQMRINFVDKPGSFTHLSYADVIEGNFDPDVVKHKLVVVGITATGEPDLWITPISNEKMSGVEIHANAIDTILRQRFLVEEGRPTTALWMLLLVGISGLALPFIRLRWGLLLIVVLLAGYVAAVFFAFDSGRIMNILYPLITLPLVYITIILCQMVSAQSDKGHIKDLFGRYVSPQVAGEILNLADADQLRLAGARREITVLFADIRGFTTLSEQMEPESIVAMLNSYLSVIIDRILANEGMINKFAGDSIMAVWNAPQDQPDHALLAVKAALESQRALANMQRASALPQVQFGIGVNSGQAVAGNVGSEGRTEYTIIGDAVNLASRLCSSAPGGHVWIGPQTHEQVKDEVEVEELEPQYFKGKAEPVTVYRVLTLRHREGTNE